MANHWREGITHSHIKSVLTTTAAGNIKVSEGHISITDSGDLISVESPVLLKCIEAYIKCMLFEVTVQKYISQLYERLSDEERTKLGDGIDDTPWETHVQAVMKPYHFLSEHVKGGPPSHKRRKKDHPVDKRQQSMAMFLQKTPEKEEESDEELDLF